MVVLTVHLDQLGAEVGTRAGEHLAKGAQALAGRHPTLVLGHEDRLRVERGDDVPASTVVVLLSHRRHMLGGMLVRYRYRIEPTPGQRQALARAFGCARVVYNDALAERRRASLAGEKLSDTELQRRVVTLGKTRPERAWLAEVASVVLVKACQDARRAYRNWFDSRSGRRKGRRVGHPRFRTKHGRQSIRLTRNGFALHGTRLSVAKVGDMPVRWSRPVPSLSSGTRPRCHRLPAPPGSALAQPRSQWSPAATGPSSRLPTRGIYGPPSGNSPAHSGSSPASRKDRPTAPRPATGLRSRTERFATGGPTITTSSPVG